MSEQIRRGVRCARFSTPFRKGCVRPKGGRACFCALLALSLSRHDAGRIQTASTYRFAGGPQKALRGGVARLLRRVATLYRRRMFGKSRTPRVESASTAVFVATNQEEGNLFTTGEDDDELVSTFSSLVTGSMMSQVIMEDLDHIKKTYGRKRRTVIENREEAVFEEKKVEEAEVCFLMDRFGYAKVLDKNTYERNKETVHGEYKYVFTCMNTDKICLFTNKGQMHTVKVMDLPLTRLRDKGVPIDNLSNFSSAQEELLCVSNMEAVKNASLIFVTKSGMIKQVPGTEFDVIKRTIASTKLTEEDELVLVELCDTMDYVVLQSHAGYFLRFLKEEVPEKKKAALGVRAMKMGDRDYLEHAYLLESRMEYQIEYKEKQMVLNKIKLGKRDTKGTKVRV